MSNKLNQNKLNQNKLNLNKRKIVFLILSVICMVLIFMFSCHDADKSTEESHAVGMVIGEVTQPDWDAWEPETQVEYAVSIDHPVRKTAHFLEYMALGFCFAGFWFDSKRRILTNVILPFIAGALYAVSDELHQLLVAGRAGMLTDVLLDSSGVLTGVLLITVVFCVYNRLKKRRKHN